MRKDMLRNVRTAPASNKDNNNCSRTSWTLLKLNICFIRLYYSCVYENYIRLAFFYLMKRTSRIPLIIDTKHHAEIIIPQWIVKCKLRYGFLTISFCFLLFIDATFYILMPRLRCVAHPATWCRLIMQNSQFYRSIKGL